MDSVTRTAPMQTRTRAAKDLSDIAETIARLLMKADSILHGRDGFAPLSYTTLDVSGFLSKAQAVVMSLDVLTDRAADFQACVQAREAAFREYGNEFPQDAFPNSWFEDAGRRAIETREHALVMAFRAKVSQ